MRARTLLIPIATMVVLSGCSADSKSKTQSSKVAPKVAAALGQDLVVDGDNILGPPVDTRDGSQIFDTIQVINGGVLLVTDYDATGTTGMLTLQARLSITVDDSSAIFADSAGYRRGETTGDDGEGPGGGGAGASNGGGGGGHAGAGADGTDDPGCGTTDGAGGASYGSSALPDLNNPAEITLGSGGGAGNDGEPGGDGGGAILLLAPTISMAGSIQAKGDPGISGGDAGGGGAGGSIVIAAENLDCGTVPGFLDAGGGHGGDADDKGGGGAGGWIKISSVTTVNACNTDVTGGFTGSCVQAGSPGQVVTDAVGLTFYCGNSTTEAWEGCDDGGMVGGECSDQCLIENNSSAHLCEYETQCASGICDTSGGTPGVCVQCMDDNTGTTADTGCGGGTPYCDTSGTNPVCIAGCADDQAAGAVDTGCTGPVGSGNATSCDESGSNPVCLDCMANADCTVGDACNTATNVCVTGCLDSTHCSGGTPHCDTSGTPGVCVECLDTSHCSGGEVCSAAGECHVPLPDAGPDAGDPDAGDTPDAGGTPDAGNGGPDAGPDGGSTTGGSAGIAGGAGCAITAVEGGSNAFSLVSLLFALGWLVRRKQRC